MERVVSKRPREEDVLIPLNPPKKVFSGASFKDLPIEILKIIFLFTQDYDSKFPLISKKVSVLFRNEHFQKLRERDLKHLLSAGVFDYFANLIPKRTSPILRVAFITKEIQFAIDITAFAKACKGQPPGFNIIEKHKYAKRWAGNKKKIREFLEQDKLHFSSSIGTIPPLVFQMKSLTSLSIENKHIQDYLMRSQPVEIAISENSRAWNQVNFSRFPSNVASLTTLTVLRINNTFISSIPEGVFSELKNLHTIDLSDNRIKQLPSDVFSPPPLKALSLKKNRLTEIPSHISLATNLERLDVSHNQLTTLPDEMRSLANLVVLFMASNKFTSLPGTTAFLNFFPQLKILYWINNPHLSHGLIIHPNIEVNPRAPR